MSLFEENHNRFTNQLNELRKELNEYVLKRYGLTEFARDAIDYAMGLITPDEFYCVETEDVLKELKPEIKAHLEQKVTKEALIEYWEGKALPKKTHRKILKGIPAKNNFPKPDKLERKLLDVELTVEVKHLRKQKKRGLCLDQNYNQPQE